MGSEWQELTLKEHLDIDHGFAFPGSGISDVGDDILVTPGNFAIVPLPATLPDGAVIITETDGTVDGRTTVTIVGGRNTRSGDFGIRVRGVTGGAVTPTPGPANPTGRTRLPTTGSDGTDLTMRIAVATLIAGFVLLSVRRRRDDDLEPNGVLRPDR